LVAALYPTDYSEIFYDTLEHMHSLYPYTLEILAFPFDHPNINTTSCTEALQSLEKQQDRKIHIMEPIQINGPETHPVFKYLKELFDMKEMDPNFAHYFFVNPDGNLIELHYGLSYNSLKSFVERHVKEDLSDNNRWEL
jgi:glutathione peroxidase-family protein